MSPCAAPHPRQTTLSAMARRSRPIMTLVAERKLSDLIEPPKRQSCARGVSCMPHSAPSWKRRFAVATDTAGLLLLGLALLIQYAGGVRLHIGRVGVTARSGTRALLLAVILLMGRHVVVLRPSVADRAVSVLRRLQKLSRSSGRLLAAVADTAVVALGLLTVRPDAV